MAKKVSVELESDLSGDTADETVSFGLDGVDYEIDLTTSEAKDLREALDAYVVNGRMTSKPRAKARRTASKPSGPKPERVGPEPKLVRSWAVEQGIEVPARGRIPAAVFQQYEEAVGG